jgi:3-oxoadipate enol-lactonase
MVKHHRRFRPAATARAVALTGLEPGRAEHSRGRHDARSFPGDIITVLDAVAEAGGPPRSVIVGQSIGAAAALRTALARPDLVAGVVLAHSPGGLRHDELTALVRADRPEAEKLPVLDRLLTPGFRERQAPLAFLFRQLGTFNTATMQDLRNLSSDGRGTCPGAPATA